MAKLLTIFCLLLMSPFAWSAEPKVPLPAAVKTAAPDLHLLGAGHLNWLFFSVYNAALWISGDQYTPTRTFALGIDYERSFSSHELVKTSLKEMRRLDDLDAAQLAKYRTDLQHAFPDVKPGDQIVGLCMPRKYTAFYYNGVLHSKIDDPQFCPEFFAIWLSPHTQVPGLRNKLLDLHE